MSQQRKFFYLFAAVIFLANIFVMNDYTTYLNGAETENILTAQAAEGTSEAAAIFPAQVTKLMGILSEWQPFFLRLPSVLVLLLTLFSIYFFGKKIFRQSTALMLLLVLGSSLLVPNLAKFASNDMWLLLATTTYALTTILFAKQKQSKWLIINALSLLLGFAIHPLSMCIFAGIFSLYVHFRHPKGRENTALLATGVTAFALLLIGYFGGFLPTAGTYFGLTNLAIRDFTFMTFIGVLPWIAFLPAALVDMWRKMRKGEEFSTLTFGWLIAACLSMSVAVQVIFALLIAKQIQLFFAKNYPYENLVKLFAVLHLVGAFILGAGLMVNGWQFLQGTGFRAGMAVNAVYYIPTFMAIIGIFGRDLRLILGGSALAGLFVTLFFWLQLNYIFENYRSLPRRAVAEAQKLNKSDELLIAVEGFDATSNIAPYANVAFTKVSYSIDNQVITNNSNAALVISDTLFNQANFPKLDEKNALTGWGKKWFIEEKWWVK